MSDENGSTEPLRLYDEKTLVIVLPGELTVFDIGILNSEECYVNLNSESLKASYSKDICCQNSWT